MYLLDSNAPHPPSSSSAPGPLPCSPTAHQVIIDSYLALSTPYRNTMSLNAYLERKEAVFRFMAIRTGNIRKRCGCLYHGRLTSVLPRSRTHDLGARIIKASLSRRVGYDISSFSMASNVTQKGTLSHVCLVVSMERGGKTAYFPPTLTIFTGREDARILTCVKSKRKRPTLRSCL